MLRFSKLLVHLLKLDGMKNGLTFNSSRLSQGKSTKKFKPLSLFKVQSLCPTFLLSRQESASFTFRELLSGKIMFLKVSDNIPVENILVNTHDIGAL